MAAEVITIDTRIRQAKALADDCRTACADILEETNCDALWDARQYLNWALMALDRANAELAAKHGM